MKTEEARPKGIVIITLMFVIAALANFYMAVWGDGEQGWLYALTGLFQLGLASTFFELKKAAYLIMITLNGLALVASGLFVIKGVVQYFQSAIATHEILLFLPPLIICGWIISYLRKREIKGLFA